MSLRKSPTWTPKMLAAKRRNALQHGHSARSLRRCMLALRENAEEFDRVYGVSPVVSAPGRGTAPSPKRGTKPEFIDNTGS